MATSFPAERVIVLGGGLAGFSAANTVLEYGGKVILLDKSAFCGYVVKRHACIYYSFVQWEFIEGDIGY
jgi:thioredoxin reductase